MTEINTTIFVVILQFLIMMVMLCIVLIFMLLKMRKKIRAQQNVADELKNKLPDASMYFNTESRLTKDHYNALNLQEAAHKNWRDLEHEAMLLLRSDLLDLELTYAKIPEQRENDFWIGYHKSIEAILKKHELYSCLHTRFVEDEIGIHELFSTAKDEIEQLKHYVTNNVKNESTKTELNDLLDRLASRQRELGDCIYVLEDESAFLREQIAALLK